MEHIEAQQAAHHTHRLCRGVGHLHDHFPARSRQRTDQRADAAERRASLKLNCHLRRLHEQGPQRAEGGTACQAGRARRRNHAHDIRRAHLQCQLGVAAGGYKHLAGRQLHLGTVAAGRLSGRHPHQQAQDARGALHQRHRPAEAAQGGGAERISGAGTV